MKHFEVFIACALFFQLMQTHGAPRRKRWIPQRYSDDEYGNDAAFVPSGPTYGSASASNSKPDQNYMSYYWPEYFSSPRREESYGDYSGMFRANDNPVHVMVDPVQQLQNVHAYSYAQNYAPSLQFIGYNPYGRAHSLEHGGGQVGHEGLDGRTKLLQVLLGGASHNQNAQQDRFSQVSAVAPGPQTEFVVVNQPSTSSFSFPSHQQFGTLAEVDLLPSTNTNAELLNILASPQFANSDFTFQSPQNNPFSFQSSSFNDNPFLFQSAPNSFNQFSLSSSVLNDNALGLTDDQILALTLAQNQGHSLSSPAGLRVLLDQQKQQQEAEAKLFIAANEAIVGANDHGKQQILQDVIKEKIEESHHSSSPLETKLMAALAEKALNNEKIEESHHSSPLEDKLMAALAEKVLINEKIEESHHSSSPLETKLIAALAEASESSHGSHPQHVLSTGLKGHSLQTNAELAGAEILEQVLESKLHPGQSNNQKSAKIQKSDRKIIAQALSSGLQQHSDSSNLHTKTKSRTNEAALALAIQMAHEKLNAAKAQQTMNAMEAIASEQQEAENVQLEANVLTAIQTSKDEAALEEAIESLQATNDANVKTENEAILISAVQDFNEKEKDAQNLETQHQPLALLSVGGRAHDVYEPSPYGNQDISNYPTGSYQDTSVPMSPLDAVYPGVSQPVSIPSRGPVVSYQTQPQYTQYTQSVPNYSPVYDYPQQYSIPFNSPVSNYGQVIQPVRYGYANLPVSSNLYAPYSGQGVTAPAYSNNGYYAIPRVTRNSVMLQAQPQPLVKLVYGAPQPKAPYVIG